MMRKKKIILSLAFISFIPMNGMNIVNLMWPYDTSIRPTFPWSPDGSIYRWQTALYAEGGFHNAIAFNDEDRTSNPLRIWNCEQNALAMLEGFPEDSPIS